jgi:hypothetical protein
MKKTLNVLWITFHGLMNFMSSPCILSGLGAKSIKPRTQKTTIGSNVIC